MATNFLAVKFFVPQPANTLVDRPALNRRFALGLNRPLTLISAPAGFGKSTLVSTWLNASAARLAADPYFDVQGWLSLDAHDNLPAQFWAYFTAALAQGKASSLFALPLELIQSDPPPPIQAVQDVLLNEIAGCRLTMLLVLDDYHAIQNPEIHEQLTYFLEHQPPNLHLVIATRADPALPIARLRARGQLSEFRAADLRMNDDEAGIFLSAILGQALGQEDMRAIEHSTEGWAAGLQMAALALQAVIAGDAVSKAAAPQERVHEFVTSFSGKNVYILDYLAEEVFNRQPAGIQDFLLKTSVLERLSAGLCAALLESEGEEAEHRSKTTLEQLERANLFLIPLDHERQWYRYHHLFADLLRARLEQANGSLVPDLHLRAGRWFERHGLIEEAIRHNLAGKNWGECVRLMEAHLTTTLENGQLASVLNWIEALPAEVLSGRPSLCIDVAWALAHAGQYPRVPALVEMAESALADLKSAQQDPPAAGSADLPSTEVSRIHAVAAELRAFGLILAGKPDQALALAQSALASSIGLAPREMAWLNWMCGYAWRGMGRLDQAIECFSTALETGRKAGGTWEDLSTDLGIAYRFNGRLSDAMRVFQEALAAAEKQGLRNKGNLSRVEAFLSAALLDQNRLEEALEHAQKAVYYLQWWPSHNHITTAYAFLGLVLTANGRFGEAAQALANAVQEQHKGQVMPTVLRLVEHANLRLWLASDQWERVEDWLASQPAAFPELSLENRLFNEYEETGLLWLARVWIAKGRKEGSPGWIGKALPLLAQLEISADRSRWVHASVEIGLLQAIALRALGLKAPGKPGDDLRALARSLAQGLPNGYRRVYLQEGRAAAELLQAWLKAFDSHHLPPGLTPKMVKELYDQFDPEPQGVAPHAGLAEDLTERELEVLQLLALGLSNKDIAARLVLSEGTVKTHVHNLIGKLGVQSRTQVLARAKTLKLV